MRTRRHPGAIFFSTSFSRVHRSTTRESESNRQPPLFSCDTRSLALANVSASASASRTYLHSSAASSGSSGSPSSQNIIRCGVVQFITKNVRSSVSRKEETRSRVEPERWVKYSTFA
eukprot:31494-Pelagococcus_subviridis.AAC.8